MLFGLFTVPLVFEERFKLFQCSNNLWELHLVIGSRLTPLFELIRITTEIVIVFPLSKSYTNKKRFSQKEIQHSEFSYLSYRTLGPFGFDGGCQDTARKDSLMATTESAGRPCGIMGNVVTGVGRLSVQPPTKPPPPEQARMVTL